jgi:hypothetical protein
VVPAPDAALEDEDLPGEDPVPLLLQVEIVRVLQEDLGPAQLVVRLPQHGLADPRRGRTTVNL